MVSAVTDDTPAKGFRDRVDAGRRLAALLGSYARREDVVVLALPRGGVPVGAEVAAALGAPLDVFTVRKLGVPGHEELAMGAVATGGVRVLNDDVVRRLHLSADAVEAATATQTRLLAERELAYRGRRDPPQVERRTAVLVDDGLATGATMRAVLAALRPQRPFRTVVAVPVGAPPTCAALRAEADEVVCVITPRPFRAVGHWYDDFSETTDAEVRDLLSQAERRVRALRP